MLAKGDNPAGGKLPVQAWGNSGCANEHLTTSRQWHSQARQQSGRNSNRAPVDWTNVVRQNVR